MADKKAEEKKEEKAIPKTAAKYRYVGPKYQKGLVIDRGRKLIKPKEMTDEQIEKLIKDFPNTEKYFKKR
jgi:2,4-dienoyl-CoA reductase-like NADH-dependent reductase (Old Yellow Enzyme family)